VVHCTHDWPTIIGAECVVGHSAHLEAAWSGTAASSAPGRSPSTGRSWATVRWSARAPWCRRDSKVPPGSMALGVPCRNPRHDPAGGLDRRAHARPTWSRPPVPRRASPHRLSGHDRRKYGRRAIGRGSYTCFRVARVGLAPAGLRDHAGSSRDLLGVGFVLQQQTAETAPQSPFSARAVPRPVQEAEMAGRDRLHDRGQILAAWSLATFRWAWSDAAADVQPARALILPSRLSISRCASSRSSARWCSSPGETDPVAGPGHPAIGQSFGSFSHWPAAGGIASSRSPRCRLAGADRATAGHPDRPRAGLVFSASRTR